jgi:SulP family sulfate permease
LGVLVFEVLAGLLIGVFLSLALLMARVVRPRIVELGIDPESGAFRSLATEPEAETIPGLRVIRFDAPIFFANAGELQAMVTSLLDDDSTRAIVVDVDAGDDIDTTSADTLGVMLAMAEEKGVTLVFARMHETVRRDLERSDIDLAGRSYPQVSDAVEAYRRNELRR